MMKLLCGIASGINDHPDAVVLHEDITRQTREFYAYIQVSCGAGEVEYLNDINDPEPFCGNEDIDDRKDDSPENDRGKGYEYICRFIIIIVASGEGIHR